jgi:polysaccharide export outer membrane protein
MMRVLFFALLLSFGSPALAGYVTERGDVLSIVIAEEPKLGRETKVNADGKIMLPQLGSIDVAGHELDSIRERIEQELTNRGIIKKPTVIVEIVAYRPFYIGGSVVRPGAIAFEPGLTVRHALLLAGGLAKGREGTPMDPAEVLTLKAKWRVAQYQLLQINSRIVRLKAEMDRADDAAFESLDTKFVPSKDVETLTSLDANLLHARNEERTENQGNLKDISNLLDFELSVLTKQAEHQEKERELQRDQVANARALYGKGYIPLPRLQELEREESRLSRDLLENQAFAARARQNKATIKYQFESAETKRQIDLQQELREAMLERARLEAEAEGVSNSLLIAGVSLKDNEAVTQPAPTVTIHRTVEGSVKVIQAAMDNEINPGDVLDVALVLEN